MTSCAHPARSKSIDLENCGVVSFFPVCFLSSLSPRPGLRSRGSFAFTEYYCGAVFPPPEEMFSRAGSVKSGFDGLKQGPKVTSPPSPHAGRQGQHRGWSSIGRRQSMQNAEMEGDAILFLVTTALKQPYLIKRKYCGNT
jgi:hypothetical protein